MRNIAAAALPVLCIYSQMSGSVPGTTAAQQNQTERRLELRVEENKYKQGPARHF